MCRVFKKLKLELPLDPVVSLGHMPKELYKLLQRLLLIRVIADVFITARHGKQPTCPSTDE